MLQKKIILALCGALFISLNPGLSGAAETRGLFVSMIQDPQVLSSRQSILDLIAVSKSTRVNVLFVQVYRANRSWFPSSIADATAYRQGAKALGEDPLKFLIRQAHSEGIQVHAWLNLLSLSANEKAPLLERYGPDILTQNIRPKRELSDYKIDRQYFLEPGDPRVCRALLTLCDELLDGYPGLDGVLFDYIRYPDRDPAYGWTRTNLKRFRKSSGLAVFAESNPQWKNWKRSQVTSLVERLSRKARATRPGLVVSSTACAPYSRAYHEALQEWNLWLDRNLVDFVTLMSYSPDPNEFERFVMDAKKKTPDFGKVNVAVGAYQLGERPENLADEIEKSRLCSSRGWVVLHYGNLAGDPLLMRSFVDSALEI